VPGYEAPCYVAWSAKNRSPLVRIPASRGLSTRIELRNPDPAANPYLALAVMLASGLDGIRRQMKLCPPTNSNIYTMSEEERKVGKIPSLPGSLQEAVEALKQDEVVKSALGEHILARFIEAKEIEWIQFSMQVHPWEREQFMSAF